MFISFHFLGDNEVTWNKRCHAKVNILKNCSPFFNEQKVG